MTHRERILTALKHQEPDRVPIDFGGSAVTGIMAIAYNKLTRYLGIDVPAKVYDLGQQLARPDQEVIERMGGDAIELPRLRSSFLIANKEYKKGKLPDGSDCLVPVDFNPIKIADGGEELRVGDLVIGRRPKDCPYFEYTPMFSEITKESLSETVGVLRQNTFDEEEMNFLRTTAKYLYENTDYAVLGTFWGDILSAGLVGWAFSFEKFLMELVLNPKLIRDFLEELSDYWIEGLKKYLAAVGDYVQIIVVGEDLGTEEGPLISPKMYREMIKPYHAKIYQYIKSHSKAYLFMHCCGAIREFIPDLIEMGVDILNPVQTSAKGMDPAELKKEFGKYLTFWGGGCDTQKTLPFGTIEEIKSQVKERIGIFAPGGGDVFNPVHNIQANIPPEKIVAMYDAAREYGKY